MNRRGFLTGLGAMIAAPAIVHAGNLMPVRAIERLILPSSPNFAELTAITRKAFLPRLFVQIYNSSPFDEALTPPTRFNLRQITSPIELRT